MGPKLQLNYNLMDMKNLFVGDKNCYEVRKVHNSVPSEKYQRRHNSNVDSSSLPHLAKTITCKVKTYKW